MLRKILWVAAFWGRLWAGRSGILGQFVETFGG